MLTAAINHPGPVYTLNSNLPYEMWMSSMIAFHAGPMISPSVVAALLIENWNVRSSLVLHLVK